MKIFLWSFAVLWIVFGVGAIISPEKVKNLYRSLVKPVKKMAALPIIGGILFLWSSQASRIGWFVILLGIIALLKGAMFLFFPVKTLRATLDWWLDMPDKVYRAYGVMALIFAWIVIASIL